MTVIRDCWERPAQYTVISRSSERVTGHDPTAIHIRDLWVGADPGDLGRDHALPGFVIGREVQFERLAALDRRGSGRHDK